MTNNLEQVIRKHVAMGPHVNSKGFNPVLCKVCNDHGRKGMRAGFLFSEGEVRYNCFNCGHKASYTPTDKGSISRDMLQVLDAFFIPASSYEDAVFDDFTSDVKRDPARKHEQRASINVVNPLENFYKLTEDGSHTATRAIEYLRTRGVDWTTYPFYLAKRTDNPILDRWCDRLIFPVFKSGDLIFYQGRDLTGTKLKKYISCDTPRDSVLYGYDKLFENRSQPLYVVEGWFDAFVIDGVAVFSNELTSHQISALDASPRPKVVIPDRQGRGFVMARQAIKRGWSVSIPDTGSCKDVSEMVSKYGMAYTYKAIRTGVASGFEAETLVNLYCKK